MCGRYYVDESALKEIQKLPGDLDWTRQEKYAGDICPSQEALVIRNGQAVWQRKDGSVMFLAGCYNLYEDGHSFVILTTAANPSMEPVHDRMPLILEPGEVKRWLLDDRGAEQILHNTPALLNVSTEYEQLRLF